MVGFHRWHASLWWIRIHRRKDRLGSIPRPSRLKLASLDALDDHLFRILAGRPGRPVPKEEAAQAFLAVFAFEANSRHALVVATSAKGGVEVDGRSR